MQNKLSRGILVLKHSKVLSLFGPLGVNEIVKMVSKTIQRVFLGFPQTKLCPTSPRLMLGCLG